MESFLHKVAQQIIDENPNGLLDVAVVFNNWRPSQFLKKELLKIKGEPFFLPTILRMDDIVSNICNLEITPHEFLLYELYRIHCMIVDQNNNEKEGGTTQEVESFENFISTGELMLSDFSEIDLYMADAEKLFDNLHELKKIGEWHIDGSELSQFQKDYLSFYRSLYSYYEQLKNNLLKQGKAYSGMAYRAAAENIDSMIDKTKFKKIYFIGFNVMAKAERELIKCFIKHGIGRLILDGDNYYFLSKEQEAGDFLRQNKKDSIIGPMIGTFDSNYAELKRKINIVECPSDITQAKYAGQLVLQHFSANAAPENIKQSTDSMSDESKEEDLTHSAIILADESMLINVLNALPSNAKNINVTMGFPFDNTAIHTLALKMISLYSQRREKRFYHQDVKAILSDSFIESIIGRRNYRNNFQHHQLQEKIVYLSFDDIKSLASNDDGTIDNTFDHFFSEIFNITDDTPKGILNIYSKIIIIAAEHYALIAEPSNQQVMEQEELMAFKKIIDYLHTLQDETPILENLSTLEKIYTRLAHRHKVTFQGNPLEGLQVLGMLETRNIDFDNIILLSVNEGILPTGRNENTLIPFNLKTAFGLPTYKEKDAIYAYHFYCMLQRASNIHLLYSSDEDGISKGEASRFILQIEKEMAPLFNNISLSRQTLMGTITSQQLNCPNIEKDSAIMEKLTALTQSGLSPTAINAYISCPQKYYYQYVVGLNNDDDINDELDTSELGTLIHETLRSIYMSDEYIDSEKNQQEHRITVEYLKQTLPKVDDMVMNTFQNKIIKGRLIEGRNQFLLTIAQTLTKKFIQREIEALTNPNHPGLKILLAEKTLCRSLSINVNGQKHEVKIKGQVDRVDRVGNTTRIIDYKTGSVKDEDLKANPSNITSGTFEKIASKWMQVMTYAWMYRHSYPDATDIQTGIYALQKMQNDLLIAKMTENKKSRPVSIDDIDLVETVLTTICSEMLDSSMPFVAKPENKGCNYCVAKAFCLAAKETKW